MGSIALPCRELIGCEQLLHIRVRVHELIMTRYPVHAQSALCHCREALDLSTFDLYYSFQEVQYGEWLSPSK